MGMIIEPESEMGKELERWNTPKRFGGQRCDGFEEYPKQLYRARELANGTVTVFDLIGELSPDANKSEQARTFNIGNVMKVHSDHEEANWLSRGWRSSVQAAIDVVLDRQRALSTAAAETNYRARGMSEKAQQELQAANDATHEHVADVPAPKKRRGRQPKAPVTVS